LDFFPSNFVEICVILHGLDTCIGIFNFSIYQKISCLCLFIYYTSRDFLDCHLITAKSLPSTFQTGDCTLYNIYILSGFYNTCYILTQYMYIFSEMNAIFKTKTKFFEFKTLTISNINIFSNLTIVHCTKIYRKLCIN